MDELDSPVRQHQTIGMLELCHPRSGGLDDLLEAGPASAWTRSTTQNRLFGSAVELSPAAYSSGEFPIRELATQTKTGVQ